MKIGKAGLILTRIRKSRVLDCPIKERDPMLHHITSWKSGLPRGRWAMFVCLLLPFWGWGQAPAVGSKPLLDFNGQVSLNTDLYYSDRPQRSDSLIQRPGFVQSLNARLGFNLLGFEVPVKFDLRLPASGFGVTSFPQPNPLQLMRMPSNRFSIHPMRKNLKFSLGAFNSQVSKLTAGNIAYAAGVGASYKILFLNVAGSIGMTHQMIGRDSILGIPGAYPRMMATAQVGLGDIKKTHLYLNFARVKDDTTWDRLPEQQRPLTTPWDGSVISVDVGAKLGKRLYSQVEYAISAFSSDQGAAPLPIEVLPPKLRDQISTAGKLILFNSSTRFGLAMDATTTYKTKKLSLSFKVAQRSLGYRSIAFYSQVNDYRNYTGSAERRLFKGKGRVAAEVGMRQNNLSLSKSATQTQAIFSGSANLLLFKSLQLGINGSNFGIAIVNLDTSIGQRQLSKNLGAHASLSFGKTIRHFVTVSGSVMEFEDQMDPSVSVLLVRTQMVNLYHQVVLPSRLSFNVGVNSFQNAIDNASNQRSNLSLGFQHQLWKNKIGISGQLRYSDGLNDPSGTGRMIALAGNTNLQLSRQLSGTVRYDIRYQVIHEEPVFIGFLRTQLLYKF